MILSTNYTGLLFFSSLDLAARFWQVPLTDSSKEKTAFVCREGLFQFNIMPIRLCNGIQTFQRIMDMVVSRLRWECAVVYVDDVNYSRGFATHIVDLRNIFSRIRTAGLKLKAKNRVIGLPKLVYLGYVVSVARL